MRPSATVVRSVVGRDRAQCARCGRDVGTGQRGVDWSIHHRAPAGMGGSRRAEAHGPPVLVVLCGSGVSGCHGHVESHRTEAYAEGWLVRRPADPATVPIDHAVYGRVYLTADGGTEAVT